MIPNIGADLFDDHRRELIEMFKDTGVELFTESSVLEITADGVIISGKSAKKTIKADTVVLALGMQPEAGLLPALEACDLRALAIGDCVEPRKIINAIWEGFRQARLL